MTLPDDIMPFFLRAFVVWCFVGNIVQCLSATKNLHISTELSPLSNIHTILYYTVHTVHHLLICTCNFTSPSRNRCYTYQLLTIMAFHWFDKRLFNYLAPKTWNLEIKHSMTTDIFKYLLKFNPSIYHVPVLPPIDSPTHLCRLTLSSYLINVHILLLLLLLLYCTENKALLQCCTKDSSNLENGWFLKLEYHLLTFIMNMQIQHRQKQIGIGELHVNTLSLHWKTQVFHL